MRFALAIFCSLLLAGTLSLPAQAIAAANSGTACCCGCAAESNCCVTEPATDSTPVSAQPVSSVNLQHPLAPASAAVAWTLPGAEADPSAVPSAPHPATPGAPLFARDCARLL